MAQCFEKGCGVPQSNETALSFYRCAAKLGLVDALHTYGIITYHGYVGCPKDQNTGYYYMKVAAKKADKLCPYPLYDLGLFYEQGGRECGVSEDYKYALENFEKGAKLGDPNCKYKLALSYEYGDLELRKNKQKSIEYYKSSLNGAVKGHPGCAFRCGECAMTGTGTEENILEALFWFEIAQVFGHGDALIKIHELREK